MQCQVSGRNLVMYRVLLIFVFALCTFFSIQTKPVSGKDVPFIIRTNLPGLRAKLTANKGKVIVLDFWVHDCDNCQKAVPFMSKMYNRYKKEGLLIIGLSVDRNPGDARAFVSAAGTKYPTFLADESVMDAYGLEYVPYHVFIDRTGEIRGKEIGFYENKKKEIEKKIVELLEEDS